MVKERYKTYLFNPPRDAINFAVILIITNNAASVSQSQEFEYMRLESQCI
jgi:hypothetical protein